MKQKCRCNFMSMKKLRVRTEHKKGGWERQLQPKGNSRIPSKSDQGDDQETNNERTMMKMMMDGNDDDDDDDDNDDNDNDDDNDDDDDR